MRSESGSARREIARRVAASNRDVEIHVNNVKIREGSEERTDQDQVLASGANRANEHLRDAHDRNVGDERI